MEFSGSQIACQPSGIAGGGSIDWIIPLGLVKKKLCFSGSQVAVQPSGTVGGGGVGGSENSENGF